MARLYVAYGSNLNVDQMAYRCPTAKVYGAGELQGYKLLFQGREGASFANIRSEQEMRVPVLVWDIQPEDEHRLDQYEGYPLLYEKTTVSVTLDDGTTVDAMAYVMTDRRPHLGIPSSRYYRCVEQGYRDANFDRAVLSDALKASYNQMIEGSDYDVAHNYY